MVAPPPTAGCPDSPHLALRGTVIDSVLVHGAQVLHEPVRAQGPAHLDQEHGEGVRPFRAWPHPFLIPSAASPAPDHGGRRYPNPRQLTFQPVALKLLPALPMVTVRSHMPGRLAAQGQRE